MNTLRYSAAFLLFFSLTTGHLHSQTITAQLNGQNRFGIHVSSPPAIKKETPVEHKGLNAREFAQTRTVAARLRYMDQQRNLKQVIENANTVIANSKQQIQTAKQNLLIDVQIGELSEANIKAREKKIRTAEKKLQELEKSLQHILKLGDEKSMWDFRLNAVMVAV